MSLSFPSSLHFLLILYQSCFHVSIPIFSSFFHLLFSSSNYAPFASSLIHIFFFPQFSPFYFSLSPHIRARESERERERESKTSSFLPSLCFLFHLSFSSSMPFVLLILPSSSPLAYAILRFHSSLPSFPSPPFLHVSHSFIPSHLVLPGSLPQQLCLPPLSLRILLFPVLKYLSSLTCIPQVRKRWREGWQGGGKGMERGNGERYRRWNVLKKQKQNKNKTRQRERKNWTERKKSALCVEFQRQLYRDYFRLPKRCFQYH